MDMLLPDIKYFEFTGGEPFLITQHFDLLQRAVDSGYAKDIDIHYNTNGTQFPIIMGLIVFGVSYSRVILKAHTPSQVGAGALLGFGSTFLQLNLLFT